MAETNVDPSKNRKDLYQGLVKKGDYTGTYEQFESDYSDPENLEKVLYAGLRQDGDIQETSYEDFTSYYFGDIVKKKIPAFTDRHIPKSDPLSQHIGQTSGVRLSKENARTAETQSDPLAGINGYSQEAIALQIQKSRKDTANKTKQKQEEERKKLIDFYDKTEELLPALGDTETATKKLYKNWAAENGGLDRFNYLEEKAASENQSKQKDRQTFADLQEAKRQAAVSGNLDLYSKLNDVAEAGAESLNSKTDTELQLWEESASFRASLLNNKVEEVLKNPETAEKLKKLEAYKTQLEKDPSNNRLMEEYNALLQDENIAKLNRIAKQGEDLVNAEKEMAKKFPKQFRERLERKAHQQEIDNQFKSGDKGLISGLMNQLGRSATNFVSDVVKLPAIVDYDNSYGWQDKLSDVVDSFVDHVDNELLPTPSDYNSPLYYQDEKSNSVFRTDLILPKVAKLGGDMAALFLGASKISALGKAAGASTKVSEGIGLFTSSYVQTYNDYKKAGESAGMSPQDAALFATTSSAVTSALELMSPQKYLWSKEDVAKRAVVNAAAGMGKKEATKVALKGFFKEIAGENAQELAQMVGDKAIEAGANKVLGDDYFQHNSEDLINEAIETAVLTSIVAGAPASVSSASQFANRESNYKDALKLVAENRDKYLPLLQNAFKASRSTPDQVKAVMKDLDSINVPQAGAPLYMVNDTPVSKETILQKIKDKDLSGVYVANDEAIESLLKNPDKYQAPPDVKVPELKKGENGEKEKPEDKAKRVAKAQIQELVKTGDLAYDGKRATVLTPKGGQQLAMIMEQLKSAGVSPTKPKTAKAPEKSPEGLDPIYKKALDAANTLFEKYKDDPVIQKYVNEVNTRKSKSQFVAIDDRAYARLVNKYWSELPEDVQLFFEFKAEAIDFEDGGPYKGFKDGGVHGSHFTTLRDTIDTFEREVHQEPKKTNIKIEGENLDLNEFAKSEKDPEIKRVAQVLSKAKPTLSAIAPNLRVAVYKGETEAQELLTKLGSKIDPKGTRGFYDKTSNTIGVDLSSADATTAFHEAFHPIIDAIKTNKPELFKALAFEASEQELELEDGSKVKYGDYTGNKEEALVEFLADYADGKFDKFNQESIVKKVKDLINKILSAIGLKPSDFKLNLNKPQKLKDFADSLASAISQGKTVNVGKEVERVEQTRFQKAGPKKKLNRTAQKIAFDKQTEFKKLQTDIVINPDQYSYTQQDLNSKKHDLKNMTLDEVVVETQSMDKLIDGLNQGNQYAVLSAIELLRRYNANGMDTRPIFKKLREIGTGVGQLLRQFGELKNHSAEGIVSMVLGNLESMNLTLTEEQIKDLTKLAQDNFKANNDREAKRLDLIENPSKEAEKALKAADKVKEDSFHALNKFIGQVTPLGVDSMISTILQGNLLTTKSIVVNVASNIIQQPFRLAELIAGDIATYMVNRFKGQDMINPLEMYYSSTLNGAQGFGSGSAAAIKDITSGKGAENASTLEVRRNLKPLQALQQLFTKAGRATLPVNAKGKVPLSVYIEKALEGTSGWPAEAMFRMLYLGDKPFKDAARMAGAYRLFSEGGGKTNSEFIKFMANLTPEQENKLKDYSEEATFSNKRTLSKIADNFVNMVNKNIDNLAELSPNERVKHGLKVFGKFIAKANTPFVRVPANLLQYLLELAVPVLPLYGSLVYAKKGDVRKSSQLFVRAAIGGSMYVMANMLYDAGVVLASGEGDDENERQMKYEVGKPNGINIDALSRFLAGTHDPSNLWKPGDTVVDFQKLGLLGMFLGYNAEWNESLRKELGKPRSEVSLLTQITEGFGAVSRTALEMSFLQGAYTGLNSLAKGDFTNYFSELTSTMTALIIPNQVSVATRARAEYTLRADDKEAVNKFLEKQSTRLFPSLEDNVTGVYPIVGMFGDLAKQNPEKGTFGKVNPWIYQFLDITNGKTIEDPLVLEVFNLSKRVGDIPLSAPTPKVRIEDKTVTLTEQDYVYMQQIAGKYKRMDIAYEISQPEWKELSDEDKAIVLEDINETANADAREYMVNMIYDGIDSGAIIMDDDTYSYKEKTQFDFDMAKRVVESPD